jgi:cytochrome P450
VRETTRVRYDPFRPPDRDDPYSALAEGRRLEPVFFSAAVDAWIVTRYADVVALAGDTRRLSSAGTTDPLATPAPVRAVLSEGDTYGAARPMVSTDPPLHTRLRRLTGRALAQRVAGLEPRVRELAHGLVDGFAHDGHADLLSVFAYPLPVAVIAELLGLEAADHDRIKGWSDDMVALQWGRLDTDEHVAVARRVVAFHAFIRELVEAYRLRPGDGVISDLASMRDDDGRALSTPEVVRQMSGLVVAGHETTTNLIAHAVLHLLRDRPQWEAVVADTTLAASAVEETLRYDSSVLGMLRVATEDLDVAAARIRAGDRVQLAFASANRDAEVFHDPDRFDVRRSTQPRHVAFGAGPHLCVGAKIARVEVRVALEVLAERLPGLRLEAGHTVRFKPNAAFRGPEALPVRWEVAA